MRTPRRALLLAPLATPALAQGDWPQRPIRIVVPFPPGGATDLLGRLVADGLSTRLRQPVQVENLAGGGTVVGARAVASAAPDGTTLLLATSTTLAVAPALHRALPYDPVRDFAPIALLATVPFLLVVRADGPPDLAALLAEARARPGALAYGSAGPGTPHHLGMEMLAGMAGLRLNHVPYRGSAAALTDLLGGRITAMVVDLAPALPQLRAGALRPLAVTTAARLPDLADVPTIAEAGLAGYEMGAWQGLLAPSGTPGAVVARLAAEVLAALGTPEGTRRLASIGLAPMLRGPEEFAAFLPAEIARWAPIVQASGARAE
ncbi:Bug family tripartite tricarboxylate transporter substrate binding protein [Paracraurococcus lichenis]|uniref:Tripartite tricarboxylate transporter substrate-binding protein n=1 Tax=Paracraurococcus lichenis TaxID=3064888 RepID=A0ABT9DYJ8_9PROT|nr:tripartite tricarboxylate transporter substrate-binding protein [Paracraurococcus sp. LOR1-02]MDO9708983.1 tripartite tricarboxylate transporter substrate-binding protein [Paracraurococcus sp. LOR1-02]